MTKPRFIAHTGKKQPVADDVIVAVLFPDGYVADDGSNAHYWAYYNGENWWVHSEDIRRDNHIIAYRVIEQE